ncbi:MAG: hypothetical protein K8S87_06980 [Planctomycetes bacterium]|nr:hypothetical protein [Planctomycetota bacterium]
MSHQNDETLETNSESLNLGICIDRTGSSEQFQQGILSACKQIFEEIEPEYDKIHSSSVLNCECFSQIKIYT